MESESWESDKTRLVTSWIVNAPKVADLARNFVKSNPDAPIIYRAWLNVEGKKIVETPKGNEVLNLKLHFGQLSEVLQSSRRN